MAVGIRRCVEEVAHSSIHGGLREEFEDGWWNRYFRRQDGFIVLYFSERYY